MNKDTIYRQDAIDLVRDVCDAVMSECESWYDPETEDEVYKDIREVDAILKCNKEVRIALRNMPSAQPDLSEHSVWFRIGETLVEESKMHITAEQAVDKIRGYMIRMKKPERELELDGTESNIEILSELRATFNCFDELEEPCYRALSDAIQALAAQPERKTGKWIYGENKYGHDGWQCDQCGHWILWDYHVSMEDAERDLPKYCPNCGCKMER